jgi:hypothetical protein
MHGIFNDISRQSISEHQIELLIPPFGHRFLFLFQRDSGIYLYRMIYMENRIRFFSIFMREKSILQSGDQRNGRFSLSECFGQCPIEICDDVKMLLASSNDFLEFLF